VAPIPQSVLSDGVVTLRATEERDLVAVERGIHDPEVIRAFGRPTLAAEQVLQLNRDRWDRGTAATFAICDDTDRCLGHVFVNITTQGTGTVGYWLLPEARGKGLATRAVRLVSHWALHELGLARVGLLTEPSNEASLRVAEHSGFQREGLLRSYGEIDGRRVDYVCFSLLPDDMAIGG
jgi:[ribosomal protein S5]-alanine N-acetyltransferase